MRNSHYAIITVPDRVEYTCPYCYWEHSPSWDEFLGYCNEEYDAWNGNPSQLFKCDDCGRIFELNEANID